MPHNGWLKQQKFTFLLSGKWKYKIRVSANFVSPMTSLFIDDFLITVSSHDIFFSVRKPQNSSYKGTSHTGLGSQPYDFI